MSIKLPEEVLLTMLADKNPLAFKIIYLNFKSALFNVISRSVSDKEVSRDICQEVFVKAWINLSRYDPKKGRLFTWLVHIARNQCNDYFRSKWYQGAQRTTSLTLLEPVQHQHDNIKVEKIYVKELLSQLSIRQQEMIEMLFLQGYTQTEVSKLKSMPLGTVKTRSRQAIMALRHLSIQINN